MDTVIIIGVSITFLVGVIVIVLLSSSPKKPVKGGKATKPKPKPAASPAPASKKADKPKPVAAKKDVKVATPAKKAAPAPASEPAKKKGKSEENAKPAANNAQKGKIEQAAKAAVSFAQPAVKAVEKAVAAPAKTAAKKAEAPAQSSPVVGGKKKKQKAKTAAPKAEPVNAEDLEFALSLDSKTRNAKQDEEPEDEQLESYFAKAEKRNWSQVDPRFNEIEKLKRRIKQMEEESKNLKTVLKENVEAMQKYKTTNAKLLSEKNALKASLEQTATREQPAASASSPAAPSKLRDMNYIHNMLSKERDTLKSQNESALRKMEEQSAAIALLEHKLLAQTQANPDLALISRLEQELEEERNRATQAARNAEEERRVKEDLESQLEAARQELESVRASSINSTTEDNLAEEES